MKILGIETATSAGGAALVDDGRVVAEHHVVTSRTHSERLLPAVDGLLAKAGWSISDLDLVAVSIGPGSFTGLRIGISTAKGLAMAAGLPVVGVPTLDAFAMMLAGKDCPIRPLLDARKEEVFTAPFDPNGQRLGPDINVKPEVLISELVEEAPVLLAGDGVRRYKELFEQALGEKARFVSPEEDDPRPSAVAKLGRRMFQNGAKGDVDSLIPRYVRRSDAEIHTGIKAHTPRA